MKTTRPSAAARTVDMFAAPKPQDERPVEILEEDSKGERVPVEQDVDRLRENAFKCQEWATKAFGIPEVGGNEYRVSLRGQHYYIETLAKTPGTANAYGYVGLMVHERDLFNLAAVLVQAVRAKQAADSARGGQGDVK